MKSSKALVRSYLHGTPPLDLQTPGPSEFQCLHVPDLRRRAFHLESHEPAAEHFDLRHSYRLKALETHEAKRRLESLQALTARPMAWCPQARTYRSLLDLALTSCCLLKRCVERRRTWFSPQARLRRSASSPNVKSLYLSYYILYICLYII